MSLDKGRPERAGDAFPRVLGLRRATIKGVGPERSANKSTRTGVEAGNIRFVKVNGAVAMRKPQVLRKSENESRLVRGDRRHYTAVVWELRVVLYSVPCRDVTARVCQNTRSSDGW
jgi:hypothetical protein